VVSFLCWCFTKLNSFSLIFLNTPSDLLKENGIVYFFQSCEDPLSMTEHDLWRLRHYTSLPVPPTVNFSDFLFNECHCSKISIIKKSVCLNIFYLLLRLYLFRTKITIPFILLSAWKSDQSLEICTTNDCILGDEWLDLLGGVFDKWIHQLLVLIVLQNEIYNICY